MTRQGWAEKKVEKIGAQPLRLGHGEWPVGQREAVRLLRAEHKRAVRVVKREIRKLEAIKARSFCNAEIAEAYASITVLRDILAALQKGRT